ncbi:hypothetical protein PY546_23350 [Providencia stuartii]|nr:hypothetical protein [Providencia stuartii]
MSLIKIVPRPKLPMPWVWVNQPLDNGGRQLKNERKGISPKASAMTPEQVEIRALKKENCSSRKA